MRHDRIVGIPARDDDPGLGVHNQELLRGFLAAHAPGYGQIHDHGREGIAGLHAAAIALQGFPPLTGQLDLVPQVFQHALGQPADHLLVVHDQHPALAHDQLRQGFGSGRDRLWRGRQVHVEGRSPARVGSRHQMSTVVPDDGIRRGQAQAAALLPGGEIGIEDLLEMLGRYAHPLVFDGDPHVPALLQGEFARLQGQVPGPDPDGAARGHGLDRVEHQIVDHLTDLPLVDLGGPQVLGNPVLALDGRSPQHKGRRIPDQLGQGGGFLDRRSAPGKGQQLLGEPPGLPGRAFDLGEHLEEAIPRLYPYLGQREIADDPHQEVVEVMGDAPGQQAHGFELLAPEALFFHPALGRDVAEHQDYANDAAVPVADRGAAVRDAALGAVPADQQRLSGHSHDRAALQHPFHRTGAGLPRPLVDDIEDFSQRPVDCFGLGPPGQVFGHLVDQAHAAVSIRGNDPIADAAQGDGQPLTLSGQALQIGQALKPLGEHLGHLLHDGDVLV